ncbi:MAG: response regulator [Hyphomicrobiaceae bacterium]
MREPPLILVVDDVEANVDILETRLTAQGYSVITAGDGEEALAKARAEHPDLILLDVMMPKLDGLEVARRLKADQMLPFMPIIHVTAKADVSDVVAGLDAGGDEYLTKPIDHAALSARVRSILRAKALHDKVEAQTRDLAVQAEELAQWNRKLEERVRTQVAELERLDRLKRFLSPQVAELIVSSDAEALLNSHRREITVLFCDLRGFTAFSEVAEPEEVMGVLSAYHEAAGELIHRYEATLERFVGDGMLMFFNDPIPCPDPVHRAVRLAVELRARVAALAGAWLERGHRIGFGIGIGHGFATLGRIGFDGRGDYGAIGTVVNMSSRLCDLAKNGEILLSHRARTLLADDIEAESLGELKLDGLRQPVVVHRLTAMTG